MSWALLGGVWERISPHNQHKLELVIRTLSSLKSIFPIIFFSVSVVITPFFQLFKQNLGVILDSCLSLIPPICFFRKSFWLSSKSDCLSLSILIPTWFKSPSFLDYCYRLSTGSQILPLLSFSLFSMKRTDWLCWAWVKLCHPSVQNTLMPSHFI